MALQNTVQVIATTPERTRDALAAAIPLARGSAAELTVVVPRFVPFPNQLDNPAEPIDFFVGRYRAIVTALGAAARIQVCVCRRLQDLVPVLRAANGTVVIGGAAGRWLASPEERLAKRLSRYVTRVVFVTSSAPAWDGDDREQEWSTRYWS